MLRFNHSQSRGRRVNAVYDLTGHNCEDEDDDDDGWIVDNEPVRSAQPSHGRLGSSGVNRSYLLALAAMSAFCLDLQASATVSAPLELDSDCMEPRASPAAQEIGGFQAHPLRHPGSGGLGMALEEELAMLAGERDGEEELPDPPAVGRNADLLSLFRQKEKDLVLAAKLGKALLERNQDLTKQYEKMHKDLNEKLEVKK